MKLWNLKRGDRFLVADKPDSRLGPFVFDHVDGMFSYCTVEDGPNKGKVVHVYAGEDVEKLP